MKNTVICFVFSFVFFLVFVTGVGFGVALRSPAVRTVRVDQHECTCAPCLPDKFCFKCGHKSRDCPKLAWFFKRATNSVSRVVK